MRITGGAGGSVEIFQAGRQATVNTLADDSSDAAINGLATRGFGYLFNGSTWDRARGVFSQTEQASAAQTATGDSADQTNFNNPGLVGVMDITAVSGTTPTLDQNLRGLQSGTPYTVSQGGNTIAMQQATGISVNRLVLHPDLPADRVGAVDTRYFVGILMRGYDWRWVIAGTSPSFTFSIVSHLLV